MRPIITVDDFSYGIISDKTIPAKNGFSFCAGVDIHTEEGVLQVSQRLVKGVESTINAIKTSTPYWMERYEKLGTINGEYWSLLGDGKIYLKFDMSTAEPPAGWFFSNNSSSILLFLCYFHCLYFLSLFPFFLFSKHYLNSCLVSQYLLLGCFGNIWAKGVYFSA